MSIKPKNEEIEMVTYQPYFKTINALAFADCKFKGVPQKNKIPFLLRDLNIKEIATISSVKEDCRRTSKAFDQILNEEKTEKTDLHIITYNTKADHQIAQKDVKLLFKRLDLITWLEDLDIEKVIRINSKKVSND